MGLMGNKCKDLLKIAAIILFILLLKELYNSDESFGSIIDVGLFFNNSHKKSHFMTFSYKGRQGNMMFQYASFYSLAKANDKKPFIKHSNFPLLDSFKLTTPTFEISFLRELLFSQVPDPGDYAFDENNFRLPRDKNYVMDGYRCSWKYFANYSEEIKKEFRFVDSVDAKCNEILKNITNENNVPRNNCLLIGAHIRRGDFVDPKLQEYGHVPASKEYLHKAIKFFEARYSNSSCIFFVVLGNDYQWNTQNAPQQKNVIALMPRGPDLDLCVLSRCNHTIISTGSFGWWAAYLAGGEATYMVNQCRPNSSLCKGFHLDNYINSEWNWFPI